MDAPPIRHARTKEGVSIAYSVAGSGPLLVMCDGPFLPLATGWGDNVGAKLAEWFRVVRFDARGIGSSPMMSIRGIRSPRSVPP